MAKNLKYFRKLKTLMFDKEVDQTYQKGTSEYERIRPYTKRTKKKKKKKKKKNY